MRKIAIIPARGGSKRIPRKNIKPFLGKPIICYAIEAAIESKLFDLVLVSTDDEEIARVAKEAGAEVPFLRSDKNADDFASTVDVLLEVLEKVPDFEVGCCIYPTTPLLDSNDLILAFNKFQEGDYKTLFPVVRFGYPVDRCLIEREGRVSLRWKENENKRSQDFEPCFHDAGMFYWFRNNILMKEKSLFTESTGFFELDETKTQDIDNLIDWELAELKYKLLQQ